MPTINIQIQNSAADIIKELLCSDNTTKSFWVSIYLLQSQNTTDQAVAHLYYTIDATKSEENPEHVVLEPRDVYDSKEYKTLVAGKPELAFGKGALLPPIKLKYTRGQYRLSSNGPKKLFVQSPMIQLDLSDLIETFPISSKSFFPVKTNYTVAFPLSINLPMCSAGTLIADELDENVTIFDDVKPTGHITEAFDYRIDKLMRSNTSTNTALAVSPGGSIYASGDVRGQMMIGEITPVNFSTNTFQSNKQSSNDQAATNEHAYIQSRQNTMRLPRRILKPQHWLEVTKLLFFPSGVALLSAGRDLQIKLWNLEDGSNPRTFGGHTKAVKDLALVLDYSVDVFGKGTGRNFVSAGEDSTVKLWETGSGKLVHGFEIKDKRGYEADIQFVQVLPAFFFTGQDTGNDLAERELDYETKGTAVLVIHNNNSGDEAIGGVYFSVYNLYTRRAIYSNVGPLMKDKVTSMCIRRGENADQTSVFLGFDTGKVSSWTISELDEAGEGKASINTNRYAQITTSLTSPITTLSINNTGNAQGSGDQTRLVIGSASTTLSIEIGKNIKTGLSSGSDSILCNSDNSITFLAGFEDISPTGSAMFDDEILLTGQEGSLNIYNLKGKDLEW